MATMLRAFKVRSVTVLLALAACACGSDDNKSQVDDTDRDAPEGGAAAVAPSYPPALGPEDCARLSG